MISVAQYFADRRERYADEYAADIGINAETFLPKLNALLAEAKRFDVVPPVNPSGDYAGTQLTSGWRPSSVNAKTPGASPTSKHMTGNAADVYDPDGALDVWLMSPEGQYSLGQFGLYLEHPDSTPGWCHVQDVAPLSGNRVFKVK